MTSYYSNVVGVSYNGRSEYIEQYVAPGALLSVRAEPSDYDPNALAVFHGDNKIGYVPARSVWIVELTKSGQIQEIVAGNLEYDQFGVAAALPIEIRTVSTDSATPVAPNNSSESDVQQTPPDEIEEVALSPSIIRARPFGFVVEILLIPFLIGAAVLFLWWLESRTTRLIISRNAVRYETGIFSKDRRELSRSKIRTIRVQQSFLNRLLNVETLEIYTAGDSPEIIAKDVADPNRLRQILGA